MNGITRRAKVIATGLVVMSLTLGVWISTSDAGRYGSEMNRTRSYQHCPYYDRSTGRHWRYQYEENQKSNISEGTRNFRNYQYQGSQGYDNY